MIWQWLLGEGRWWGQGERESRSVVFNSLRPHWPYSPWNSPGQNIGVGSLSLFQGIFPTQGSNPGRSHIVAAEPQRKPGGRERGIFLHFRWSIDALVLTAAWTFSSCGEQGCSVAVRGFLTAVVLLQNTGSRRSTSVVVPCGPSRSVACGILPDQGSN